MSPFRRKVDPDSIAARDAFRRVASEVDAAQRVLLGAVPTSRDAGTSLPEAIDGFLAALTRVERAMPPWRTPATDTLWSRCASALVAARSQAERLRDEAGRLSFEPLNARLGDIVSPLEEFADVALELRRLR